MELQLLLINKKNYYHYFIIIILIIIEKEKEWKEKPFHGEYPELVAQTDQSKTFRWIEKGFTKKETEGMLTAAQDQALPTR